MRTVGIFKTKTHLSEFIKDIEKGEELCITARGREVAFIIPVEKYYASKTKEVMQKFIELKSRAPLGNSLNIIEMKNMGRK